MQKILLAFFFLFGCLFAQAQTDTTLTQYTGKYTFGEGSPVKEIGVVIEDGKLVATSAMGNSALNKTDTKDVFEVAAYAGTATFKRNEEGKVTGVTIQVQDMTMEGTRSEGIMISLLPLPNFRGLAPMLQ